MLLEKSIWIREVASRVYKINVYSKEAWKSIKSLRDGHMSHHVYHKHIAFRMTSGALTKSDKDVAEGLANNFEHVCNRKASVDWEFIDSIPRKPILECIGGTMRHTELGTCLHHLAWHAAPGSNGASPNGFKVLEDRHKW